MEFKPLINITYKWKTFEAWKTYVEDLKVIKEIEKQFSSPYISNIFEYIDYVEETVETVEAVETFETVEIEKPLKSKKR